MWKLVGSRWNRLAMVWERKKGGEECQSFIKEHQCAKFSKNSEPLSLVYYGRLQVPIASRWHETTTSQNKFLSLFYKWKALAHVKSLLPSAKGLSFTFMLSLYLLTLKHLLESIAVILSVMCLSQNMVNCGITLMFVSLIFLLLVFPWTSEVPQHLCFAPQIKESGIPLFHIIYEHYNLATSYVSCCSLLVYWHSFIACLTMR
jgi:hypothetical protein